MITRVMRPSVSLTGPRGATVRWLLFDLWITARWWTVVKKDEPTEPHWFPFGIERPSTCGVCVEDGDDVIDEGDLVAAGACLRCLYLKRGEEW